jgi:tetratricopeptide (TPR) repeat protein
MKKNSVKIIIYLLCIVYIFGSVQIIINYLEFSLFANQIVNLAIHHWSDSIDDPFLCNRKQIILSNELNSFSEIVKKIDNNLGSSYLIPTTYCLLGINLPGLTFMQIDNRNDFSLLQNFALSVRNEDTKTANNIINGNELSLDQKNIANQLIFKHISDFDLRYTMRNILIDSKMDDEFWILWLDIGDRLQQTGSVDDALKWFLEGYSSPSSRLKSSFSSRIGRIYQSEKGYLNLQNSLIYFNEAIYHDDFLHISEKSYVHIFIGEIYRKLPNLYLPTDSIIEFDRAIDINPDAYWAYFFKGQVFLIDLDNLYEAKKNFLIAISIDNENPYPYFYLGIIAQKQGNINLALEYFYKVTEILPEWQAPKDLIKEILEG